MYISKCLDFIGEERKAQQKELWRLLNLKSAADHQDEGETIFGATVVKVDKKGLTTFKFPDQFTKIREEKTVKFFQDKEERGEGQVISMDHEKRTVTVAGFFQEGAEGILIQSSDIVPFAVINSLKKLIVEPTDLTTKLIDRTSNVKVYDTPTPENVVKTVLSMENDVLAIQGPPGAGKSFVGRAIIKALLAKGKKILITSNSHSAINNLIDGIEVTDFKGAKISSKSNQHSTHESIKNISTYGKNIDGQVSEYQLVSGTCFALCKIDQIEFDYLIVDEASQIKCSFILAASRIAKNLIVMGDQLQLSSISVLPDAVGGESVLNYILQDHKIIPKTHGYFLNKTYRMESNIAKVVSSVFYESELTWHKKEKGSIELVTVKNSNAEKVSKIEGAEVVKIYKALRRKKVKASEILIIAPYNSQVAYLRSLIKDQKVRVLTVDKAQGLEADAVLFSCTASGRKKASAAFATVANRLNVSISRGKSKVFLISTKGLQDSEHTSKEFKQIVKMIA